MFKFIALLTPAILLVATAPALGAPVVEDSAVVNGEFELAAHPARPAMCLLFGEGYINVFQPGNPFGLPWLLAISPCHSPYVTAFGWTHGAGALYDDFNGDGDREVKILPGMVDPQMGNHNMWQAYTAPHQIWTAGSAYEVRLEAGVIPPAATISLGLSMSPLTAETPNPLMALAFECALDFNSSMLVPGAGGLIHMRTVDANLRAALPGCSGLVAAWPTMDDEARQSTLSGLRLVQHSFYDFQTGSGPVVLDGVKMIGAATVPEAAVGSL